MHASLKYMFFQIFYKEYSNSLFWYHQLKWFMIKCWNHILVFCLLFIRIIQNEKNLARSDLLKSLMKAIFLLCQNFLADWLSQVVYQKHKLFELYIYLPLPNMFVDTESCILLKPISHQLIHKSLFLLLETCLSHINYLNLIYNKW